MNAPDTSARTTVENDLLVQPDGAILRITINRPQARNALTLAMYARLAETLESLPTRFPQVRAVLITGTGEKAFAAGTDIGEFRHFSNAQDAIAYETNISKILETIEHSTVPTIAAIAGACTGGGMAIATCCDIRIAASNARFGMPMARTLGNCLSLSSHYRLVGLIGSARVRDLVLTSRLWDANEALAAGLVSQIVGEPEALAEHATALATTVANNAPLTIAVTRESLRAMAPAVDEAEENRLMLKAYLSEDFAEGVAAFLAKRPPNWRGV